MFWLWIIATALAVGRTQTEGVSGDGGVFPDPSPWDLRLTEGNSNSRGMLQAYIPDFGGWLSFCREGFGYFEAQVACVGLGFPFFVDTYEETQMMRANVIVSVDCAFVIGEGDDASLSHCNPEYEIGMSGCVSGTLVGLICDDQHSSTEDLAVVAFYSDFTFQYIDPYNEFYFSSCRVIDYFCNGVHLINVSALPMVQSSISIWRLLASDGSQVGCGQHCASSFGVDHSCNPKFGDVYLGNYSEASCGTFTQITESGELTFYNTEGEWMSVCARSFTYLEAHVVCTQLFFPFVERVYQMERSPALQSIEGINCTGAETHVLECSVQANVSNCLYTVGITCGGEWNYGTHEGYTTIVLGDKQSTPQSLILTVIAPDDGYFSNDCTVTSSDICLGAYHLNSSSSGVQHVINRTLMASGPTCVIPELTYAEVPGTSYCGEETEEPEETQQPDSGTDSSSSASLPTAAIGGIVAGLLCVVIAASVVLVAVVKVYKTRQQKRRRREWEMMWPNPMVEFGDRKGQLNRPPVRYRMVIFKHNPVRRKSSLACDPALADTRWEIPFGCITLEEEVGSGAYGSIHRGQIACEHQGDPIEVAVKLLKNGAVDSERRALTLEINMMKDIGYHRHVVSMLACCTKGQHLALVMEYIPHGNLQSFLKKKRADSEDPYASATAFPVRYTPQRDMFSDPRNLSGDNVEATSVCKATGSLTIMELLQFARQITLGMEYLSSLKIVHRDLAARNILIDKDFIMKVSDFGLSRDIYSDQCYHMESAKDRLPVRWMAPESIVDRDFTVASDVWSFGITMWEIVTYASFPYFNMSNTEVIEGVQKGYRMPKPSECPDEVYEIMLSCWTGKPKDRPSFAEVRSMLDSILDDGEYTSLVGMNFGLETIAENDTD